VTAELAGFAIYRREGILVRAGQTFNVDIQLGLSTLSETITVSGDSPMIETSKPSESDEADNCLASATTVANELAVERNGRRQKSVRRLWSLRLSAISRPCDRPVVVSNGWLRPLCTGCGILATMDAKPGRVDARS
jgi:hypothetical protein